MKYILILVLAISVISVALAEECKHSTIICNEEQDYCYCRECGEITTDRRKNEWSVSIEWEIDKGEVVYKKKHYRGLDYVIKKIIKEEKEQVSNLTNDLWEDSHAK